MKKALVIVLLVLIAGSLYADTLDNVIPVDEGQIDYFVFLYDGFGLTDPYSFDWSKGVDSAGDEYVLAVDNNSYYPTYYYFYNLSDEALEDEYNYFVGYAMGLMMDDDKETTGSIGEDYIFCNIPNSDPKAYPYGTYIGNKYYFTSMQEIPYTKFNMVWESGAMVMDY